MPFLWQKNLMSKVPFFVEMDHWQNVERKAYKRTDNYPLSHEVGPIYTRSQGQCSTQIKHSYWCKSWNQPQGLSFFTLGVKAEIGKTKKKNSICPQVTTNKCWTLWPCIGPKAAQKKKKKGYHGILGSHFVTLGAKQQAKRAQNWP